MPRQTRGGRPASGLNHESSSRSLDDAWIISFVSDPFIDSNDGGRGSLVDPLMCRCMLDGWRRAKGIIHTYNVNRTDGLTNMWNSEDLVGAEYESHPFRSFFANLFQLSFQFNGQTPQSR